MRSGGLLTASASASRGLATQQMLSDSALRAAFRNHGDVFDSTSA
jgi:hypothetical protein